MSEERIKEQLEFVKAQKKLHESGYERWYVGPKVTYTQAPCPTCGHKPSYHTRAFRMKDGVCMSCWDVMIDGLEGRLRDLAAAKEDKTLCKIDVAGYYDGYHSRSVRFEEEPRRRLADTFRNLLLELGDPAKEDNFSYSEGRSCQFLPSAGGRGHLRNGKLRLIPSKLVPLVDELDKMIRLNLEDTSDAGKAHGLALLARLAAGELTIDAMNKASVPEFGEKE